MYTQPTAENETDHKRKCVIFVFTVLHIFGSLSLTCNLLLLSNKQIIADCFVFIYNPLVYLSHVANVKVKKKKKKSHTAFLLYWLFA